MSQYEDKKSISDSDYHKVSAMKIVDRNKRYENPVLTIHSKNPPVLNPGTHRLSVSIQNNDSCAGVVAIRRDIPQPLTGIMSANNHFIKPGKTITAQLSLTIPVDTISGIYKISLTGTNIASKLQGTTELDIIVSNTSNHIPNIQAYALPPTVSFMQESAQIEAGASEFKLSVKNSENVESLISMATSAPFGISTVISPSVVKLPAGETCTVTVNIEVANNAKTDNNYLYVIATNSASMISVAKLALNITQKSRNNLEPLSPTVTIDANNTRNICAGEKVIYKINVTNNDPLGACASVYRLTINVPEPLIYTVSNYNIMVSPQKTENCYVEITAPKSMVTNGFRKYNIVACVRLQGSESNTIVEDILTVHTNPETLE